MQVSPVSTPLAAAAPRIPIQRPMETSPPSNRTCASSPYLRHVVLLPYPGRGHINPMLHLSRRLAARGFLVTVVLTEEWLSLLSHPPLLLPPSVRLRTIPNVVPSESSRGADFAAFIHAVLTRMDAPVAALLEKLDQPPEAIVADLMLPWAPAISRRMGVPVAALFPQAATVFLASQEHKTLADFRPLSAEIDPIGNADNFLSYIPRSASAHFVDFVTHSKGEGMLKVFIEGISWFSEAQCLLFNSFSKLESRALDLLGSKLSVPVYSIGSLVPDDEAVDGPCYKWLDLQPKCSVLYVSMSSFLPFSREVVEEIAAGLQMSGHPFLWVLRDSVYSQELIGEKGLVVPWCDQARVLCHPSIGGFLTHCGWNSTLEGIHAGVPMLTFPLMWDQYPNSKLIVDDWLVGLRLKDEKREITPREQVASIIRRLMDLGTEESKELRRRMAELKERSRAALREKGSSAVNFDAFVDKILCREEVHD